MASAACPICKKPIAKAHAPFCSDHCSKQDLHKWLTGQYAIPTNEAPSDTANAEEDDYQ